MKTIWKIPLHIIPQPQTFQVPNYASPLTLQLQDGAPCLWMGVDTREPLVTRTVRMYGDGWNRDESFDNEYYVGTVVMHNKLVWHFFLDLSNEPIPVAIP